jgi:hypothetical protein
VVYRVSRSERSAGRTRVRTGIARMQTEVLRKEIEMLRKVREAKLRKHNVRRATGSVQSNIQPLREASRCCRSIREGALCPHERA